MARRPEYVQNAFRAVEVLDIQKENVKAFARRWGGLGLANFARALREGDMHDQQVAAFAIGYTESAWAGKLLLPLLNSEYPEVRWAAALSLGRQRVEAAFPVLIAILQEFLPPHDPVYYCWFAIRHTYVAHILGSWGKRDAILPLHDTLTRLWQIEQQASPDEDQQLLSYYQDALAYALGQLGAFDLLSALNVPQERKRFWQVTAMMGYLNAEYVFKKSVLQIVQGAFNSEELAAFLTLVSTLLQEHMGMSQADADFAIQHYDDHYFDRWGPPIMSWRRCGE